MSILHTLKNRGKYIALDIARGMVHLHSRKIIHVCIGMLTCNA